MHITPKIIYYLRNICKSAKNSLGTVGLRYKWEIDGRAQCGPTPTIH